MFLFYSCHCFFFEKQLFKYRTAGHAADTIINWKHLQHVTSQLIINTICLLYKKISQLVQYFVTSISMTDLLSTYSNSIMSLHLFLTFFLPPLVLDIMTEWSTFLDLYPMTCGSGHIMVRPVILPLLQPLVTDITSLTFSWPLLQVTVAPRGQKVTSQYFGIIDTRYNCIKPSTLSIH